MLRAQAANFSVLPHRTECGCDNGTGRAFNKTGGDSWSPKDTVPNVIEIVDIAGLVKGASKGEGLGDQFLANIRATNAIIHVLRCFDNDNVIAMWMAPVDPIRDKEIIDTY